MGQRIRTSRVERLAIKLGWRRSRPPTDFELLRAIYERHDVDWAGSEDRKTRVFVPIDIPAIADDLDLNADMVAGRLRHDLNQKYQRHEPGQPNVSFFAPLISNEANSMNWPLLVGVLARMWEERRRTLITLNLAAGSFVISVVAIVLSLFA